jgi:hypothetical protein
MDFGNKYMLPTYICHIVHFPTWTGHLLQLLLLGLITWVCQNKLHIFINHSFTNRFVYQSTEYWYCGWGYIKYINHQNLMCYMAMATRNYIFTE